MIRAQLRRERFKGRLVSRGKDEVEAVFREHFRKVTSDTDACAGDKGGRAIAHGTILQRFGRQRGDRVY
jgi:hypothetical protein